jgi:hypothetical protein
MRELRSVREGHGRGVLQIETANRLMVESPPAVGQARVIRMLRITIAETVSEQRWTLEGRLVQPWISELESTWRKTENARRERKCVVDLKGVTSIDKNGENALAALSKEGAELIATGCYTRHLVYKIKKKDRIVSS